MSVSKKSKSAPKVKKVVEPKVIKEKTVELKKPDEKRKYAEKITLEEFWDESEDNPVKLSQISKKLLGGISSDDKKRLNP